MLPKPESPIHDVNCCFFLLLLLLFRHVAIDKDLDLDLEM